MNVKNILGVYSAPRPHWVGDGFPARSLFSYTTHGQQLSPFLLLDRAGPHTFTPSAHVRGIGQHPHRGFETVTLVYEGEVSHRDSTGAGGTIGPGDVQWMTAASGILHEEFHSPAFSQRGGTLDMVQLWVNLPARDKQRAPGYQSLDASTIPVVPLADGAGQLRVIAGTFEGCQGPARTHTPMDVWDLRLNAGAHLTLPAIDGWTTVVVVLKGEVRLNAGDAIGPAQFAMFERHGQSIEVDAIGDATLLLLGGEPIDEPLVGHGPFVMNSAAEIAQAMADFNTGRFGQIPA